MVENKKALKERHLERETFLEKMWVATLVGVISLTRIGHVSSTEVVIKS